MAYNKNIDFDIIEHLGDLTYVTKKDKQLQVNLVSKDGRSPEIDIRWWNVSTGGMERGITISEAQAKDLINYLTAYFRRIESKHPYE